MKTILILVVILIGVAAWCPWLKQDAVTAAITQQFDPAFRETKPLYSGPCTLTNLSNVHKVAFGYKADISYDCEVSGAGMTSVTYTFYNTIMGVPSK